MNNPYQNFEISLKKQAAFQDGIAMMEKAQMDFRMERSAANVLGIAAVTCNAALIPLNVILTAFDLKAAANSFKGLTKFSYDIYNNYSASGTRIDNTVVKHSLSEIKIIAANQLAKNGSQYIPGVNILIGLAEDTIALAESMLTVKKGNLEMSILNANVETKITQMKRQLTSLGVESADLLKQMQGA